MRIIGIKIDNYKSFGDTQNILRFDSENTVVLIGKNETGKSNTLLALKDLEFFSDISKLKIFEDKNKITGKEVSISIDVEFDKEELKEYNNFLTNYKSRLIFVKNNDNLFLNFEGCVSDILKKDDELLNLSEEICKFVPRFQQESKAKLIKEKVRNYHSTYIKLSNIDTIFSIKIEQKEQAEQFKRKIEEYYEFFRRILPKIIYFSNDMILKNRYTYEAIQKKEEIIGLEILLDALDFSLEELKKWLSTTDITEKQKYNIKFQQKIDKMNQEFQEYYKTNKIELLFNVDGKTLEFTVKDDLQSDGGSITSFSERSDGLKWYISMFIKLYSSKMKYKNSLILLDEPGNSLHVIAQKRLVELLMKPQNFQIIYTTHSPYMIDIEHLENIRLITKEKFTTITNGINNNKRKGNKSFKETLTPVLEAIGLSLNYNFGPTPLKDNLIVEGISDYLYINAMLTYLKIPEEKRPYILPCVGASNENRVASILIGWGYNFKCLLDTDKQGRDEYKNLKKIIIEDVDKHIYRISDEENKTIESLLSNQIKSQLNKTDKTLRAKEFNSKLNSGILKLDKKTEDNFIHLFEKIL